MEVAQLEKGFGECVMRASGILRHGGVVLYPTDTLYGLGADAFSDEAVEKVYAIKGRDRQKPIHCVVADLAMAGEYAEINDVARKLAEAFWPGPLTLVLKKKPGLDTGIARGLDTFGVRIPQSDFCLDLARTFGKPYTTTSANVAGESTGLSVESITDQLGGSATHINLVIDAGTLPLRSPSTVVNVVSGIPVVLREGAISVQTVLSSR